LGGELDQRDAAGFEELVEVHFDAVVDGFGHQTTVSSSALMATPRARSWPKAAKIVRA
jgi:hypothetical protein